MSRQPLVVRFLNESPDAKNLLVDLTEKLATYPKDMLEVSSSSRLSERKQGTGTKLLSPSPLLHSQNLASGSITLSTTLSLLTTFLLTSLTLSPISPNLTTLLPLSTREAAINSLNHHHLILTRVARAEKDVDVKDLHRRRMAEIDAMKLVLNYEGDLNEVGSGVRERAERLGKEARLPWLRCEALEGMGEEGGAARSECNKVRAEMTPCGKVSERVGVKGYGRVASLTSVLSLLLPSRARMDRLVRCRPLLLDG